MTVEGAIVKRHTEYGGKIGGLLVFEMPTGTGYQHGEASWIDAFHMAVEPSKALCRTAYEVKVSRSDFLREIREPRKRRAALRVSNKFYFATLPGVAKIEEIPLDCGLLEMNENGHLITMVDAPFRDSNPASWHFFAAFARKVARENAYTPTPPPSGAKEKEEK